MFVIDKHIGWVTKTETTYHPGEQRAAKASSGVTVVLYLVQIPSSQTFLKSFLQRCETETGIESLGTKLLYALHIHMASYDPSTHMTACMILFVPAHMAAHMTAHMMSCDNNCSCI